MITENTVAKIFETGLENVADFVEVFVENSNSSSINLLDRKIDEINSSNSFGIGIRLLFGSEAYYGYSSEPNDMNLIELTKNLSQSCNVNGNSNIFPKKQTLYVYQTTRV
mgnify:CR=1 FL=1